MSANSSFRSSCSFGLGRLDIPFELEVHDPRTCDFGKSKAFWSSSDTDFIFDETAHALEVFEHRIGKAPKATLLLSLVGNGKPAAKSAKVHNFKYNESQVSVSESRSLILLFLSIAVNTTLYMRLAICDLPCSSQGLDQHTYADLNRISFSRPTDALLLSKLADTDDEMTWMMVEGQRVKVDKRKMLYTTSCVFDPKTKKVSEPRNEATIYGTDPSNSSPHSSQGKLNVRLFIREGLLNDMSHGFTFNEQHVVTEIMGMWFNVLPFRLSDIYPKKVRACDPLLPLY